MKNIQGDQMEQKITITPDMKEYVPTSLAIQGILRPILEKIHEGDTIRALEPEHIRKRAIGIR